MSPYQHPDNSAGVTDESDALVAFSQSSLDAPVSSTLAADTVWFQSLTYDLFWLWAFVCLRYPHSVPGIWLSSVAKNGTITSFSLLPRWRHYSMGIFGSWLRGIMAWPSGIIRFHSHKRQINVQTRGWRALCGKRHVGFTKCHGYSRLRRDTRQRK